MPKPIRVTPNTNVKICGCEKHKNNAIEPDKNPKHKLKTTGINVALLRNNNQFKTIAAANAIKEKMASN